MAFPENQTRAIQQAIPASAYVDPKRMAQALGAEACAAQATSLQLRLESLSSVIQEINAELNILADKLGPVLIPDTLNQATKGADTPAPLMSQFAQRVETETEIAQRLVWSIRHLRGRVDL